MIFERLFYVNDLMNLGASVKLCLSLVFEFYDTSRECEESVVLTHANIFACKKLSPALSHDNRTWNCLFASEKLHS